jgi:hypothetical protein
MKFFPGWPQTARITSLSLYLIHLLDLECPVEAHVLKTGFPACGTVRGCRTFRRWGLVKEVRLLRHAPEGDIVAQT